jgi:hypothetical protein
MTFQFHPWPNHCPFIKFHQEKYFLIRKMIQLNKAILPLIFSIKLIDYFYMS